MEFSQVLHVPRMKPVAHDTWEVQGSLLGDTPVSDRASMDFPNACRIVGLYPSLTINSDPSGLVIPTIDDIMVLFDVNEQRRYTNQIGQTSQARQQQSFVTLGSLDTRVRDLDIEITNTKPQAGFSFRWKRWTGSRIYPDMIVSLALFVEIK